MLSQNTPVRRNGRRRAFSLVLSLTVMAMLLLLCIGAAALFTVELRVSRATASYARARLNAVAGARIALGELQRQVGPDRRITAPATLFDTAPATSDTTEGVTQPRLTGVWKAQAVVPAAGGGSTFYKDTHDAAFSGWLVSGAPVVQPGNPAALNYPKTTTLNASTPGAVCLLSAPSTPPADAPGLEDKDAFAVYAKSEPIPASDGGSAGSFAWWVSDENQKANLALRVPTGTTVADALRSGQNATHYGLDYNPDGTLKNFPATTPFNPAISNRESLVFDSATPTDPNAAYIKNARDYYHSVTPYSESLLTDVVNGGLKYDLSLLLAMSKLPAGYWGDDAYVGLESVSGAPFAADKSGWMTGKAATVATDLKQPNAEYNQIEWTRWGDVWNYARLYKHPAFNPSTGFNVTVADDVHAGSGNRLNYPPSSNTNRNTLDPDRNVTDPQRLAAWREPVITQMQFLLGVQSEAKPATTPVQYIVRPVVRPYIQLWNPYNVPLRLSGGANDGFLMRIDWMPGAFNAQFHTPGSGTTASNPTSAVRKNLSQFMVGTGVKTWVGFYISLQDNEVLAPGEVKVYSPRSGSLVNFSLGNQVVELAAGLRPFGGVLGANVVNANAYNPQIMDYVTFYAYPNDPRGGPGNATPDEPRMLANLLRSNSLAQSATVKGYGRSYFVNRLPIPYDPAGYYPSKMRPPGLLKYDQSAKDLKNSSMVGQPLFFNLFSYRLRPEANPALNFHARAYGDPVRNVYAPLANYYTPAEDGTSLAADNLKQLSYTKNADVWLSPYEMKQTMLADDGTGSEVIQGDMVTGQTYAFSGYNPATGVSRMVASYLPLGPLAGLGDLRDARLGGGAAYTRVYHNPTAPLYQDKVMAPGLSVVPNAFGNAFPHPMILNDSLISAVDSVRFPKERFFDFSWIMNSALWDSYCVTGLAAQDSPIAAFGPNKTLDEVAADFFLNGKTLSNPRMLLRDYGIGGTAMKDLVVSGTAPTADGFTKSAAMMSVNGGFNINSTSVRAWRALLAGLNGGTVAKLNDTLTPTAEPVNSGNPVLRSAVQNGPLAPVNTGAVNDPAFNAARMLAGRKLDDAQLTMLAQEIVKQVKTRGPFLSLGEFVNRRLESGALGAAGALQAAIDASGVNKFADGAANANLVTPADIANLTLPNASAVSGTTRVRGAPGFITQADLLSPIASQITPRSDTFTIRVTGDSEDGARACVELVVRRTAVFLDATNAPYTALSDSALKTPNKAFGRRIALVSTRWINRDDF